MSDEKKGSVFKSRILSEHLDDPHDIECWFCGYVKYTEPQDPDPTVWRANYTVNPVPRNLSDTGIIR